MATEFEKRLTTLDKSALTAPVCRLLDDEAADIISWQYQPIEGGFGGSHGVYRFQGEAHTKGQQQPWSLILKAISPESGHQVPESWGYWQREVLAYQSDLLQNLHGDLTAPRCFGIAIYPNQEYWLWLEDIVEEEPVTWSLGRFGLAARHLGQFNGAYLVERSIPDLFWLTNNPLQERIDQAEAGIADLPALNHHPLFAGLLPDDNLERSLEIWAERERLLQRLNQLPQVLCHHDAFRRNLLARVGPDGQAQTVAIDWAEVGRGVIGQELDSLFASSLKFVEIPIDQIETLDSLTFEGYVQGLRDVGWTGDERLARFGFCATTSLSNIADRAIKWPRVAKRVAALPADAERPKLLNAGGRTQATAKNAYLIGLGEEALSLLDILAS